MYTDVKIQSNFKSGDALVKALASELYSHEQYADVLYDILVDAIESTLDEWGVVGSDMTDEFVEQVDKHIRANYI